VKQPWIFTGDLITEMNTTATADNPHHEDMFERFLHSQVAGSVVLIAFTATALVWANSQWADYYFELANTKIGLSWGEQSFKLSLAHWIKDGLMAIFFFVVGLEVKREIVVGELSSLRSAILPVSAAVGGALLPALIYFLINVGGEGTRGWGVPMATDIAFALGILALFGSRVPIGLKVFLTALAIADDMLAVLVIAFFYTEQINFAAIALVGVLLTLIFMAAQFGIRQMWIYMLLMIGVWVSVEASGVHATVAGILIAMMVPVRALIEPGEFLSVSKENLERLEASELTRESMIADHGQRKAIGEMYIAAEEMIPPGIAFEHQLHPVQSFLILPLFALFAAGVTFSTETLASFPGAVSLGIIAGLVVGKQLGIMLGCWLVILSGYAVIPKGVSWKQLWAVSALAGIGFTMSIFISELAFIEAARLNEAKIGILIASLVSGIIGFVLLNRFLPKR
jgi:NhaA family Na+:H+ antiporter